MFLLCLGTSLKGPLIHPGSVGLFEKSTSTCCLCSKQRGGDVLFGSWGLQFEQSPELSGTARVASVCVHAASCSVGHRHCG